MKFNSILESVMTYAGRLPDRYCLVDGKKTLTYRQCAEETAKTASVLKQYGIGSGDCVIVEGQQESEFFILEFAVHALNAIFVPVERKCPDEKLARLSALCGAKLIVSIKPREIGGTDLLTYQQIEETRKEKEPATIRIPDGADLSEILFSTGTTGKEKGIVLTHSSDVAVAENIAVAVKMEDGRNVEMIPSPLNHSHGLRSAYSNFINGGTVVIFDNIMYMKKFFGMMDEYHVNAIDLVPSALSMILKLSNDKFAEYSGQLNYMEFGSAPMLDADREKIRSLLPGTPMYNFYGSTEAGRAAVYDFNCSASKERCIGKPTCNTKLIIVDDKRQPMDSDADHLGLIACGGSMCMEYYYEDPEETSRAMASGIIYSNDEAYIDEDGDIILLGRRGDVINIGGKKVSPEEIENAAKQMPGIADCGCIAVEDPNMGQAPLLFVQMDEKDFDFAKIYEFLNTTQLESYKIPKQIRRIDKIPRSFNGKLLRKELVKLK